MLYFPEGGGTSILSTDVPRNYEIVDPQTGKVVSKGTLPDEGKPMIDCKTKEPRVLVFLAD